jgi:hypothetical protein
MTSNEFNPFAESTWNEEPQNEQTDSSQEKESLNSQESNTDDSEKSDVEGKNDDGQPEGKASDDSGQEPSGDGNAAGSDDSQEEDEDFQPELDFKNEVSKKVFDSIVSGNYAEVAPIIYEQTVLSNLDKLSDEEVLKLMIQYENPDMTDTDIQKEYNDRYSHEEEKKDTSFMTEDEVAEYNKSVERAKKRALKEVKKDARDAVKYLSEKKVDIELPNISEYMKSMAPKSVDNSKEVEEYNKYIQSERAKYESSIDNGLEAVKPFEMDYKDDDVSFKVNFIPNKEDLTSMKDDLKKFTLEDFYGPRYYDAEKGEYKTGALAEDIYWLNNRDKIIKSIVSQAVSSAKANMLKNIKGVSIGDSPSSRSSSQSTKSDVDAWVEKLYSM